MPSKLETAPFHILTKNETPKLRAPPNLRREVNEAHSIQVTRETANTTDPVSSNNSIKALTLSSASNTDLVIIQLRH